MTTMLPTLITSMADLASNPSHVLSQSGNGPVAVVVDNRPAFYVLSPQAMQAMVLSGLLGAPSGAPQSAISSASSVLTVDVTEKNKLHHKAKSAAKMASLRSSEMGVLQARPH